MDKECLYVDVDNNQSNENFNIGIRWLLDNAGGNEGGLIATLGLRNMEACSEYDGMRALKTLVKNVPHVAIINDRKLELITESNIPFNGKNRPLLVIHPMKKFLDKLYNVENIPKMLVIPWIMEEIQEWVQYSNASKLGESKIKKPQFNFSEVVYLALEHMSESLNTDYSLAKPNNKDAAVNILKILYENGEHFSPEEIKICLISDFRVPAELAEEISQVADGIRHGKRYETFAHYDNRIIDYWRKESKSLK
jgi:hypothetical protein